jgi:hypothetical protein
MNGDITEVLGVVRGYVKTVLPLCTIIGLKNQKSEK